MNLSISGKTNAQEVKYKRTRTANLLEYAQENRHCGLFNDVTITVGDDNFPANRMVLSCYSHFFETMFKTEMKEKYQDSVEIKNVDANSMENLIEFIYTGSININSENVCKLISAADYLQIEDAKKFCFKFLASAITLENCLIILALADRYRKDEFTNQVRKFVADNFEDVLCTPDFKNLTNKEMATCISQLDRNTVKETTIYKAIVEWTEHDDENRGCDFPENFKLVDLHKLPPDFLHEQVSIEKLVIDNHACSNMLLPVLTERLKFGTTKDQKTRILAVGGANTPLKVIEVYNISNERKKEYPDLPVGRYGACSISLHEYVYFIGGTTTRGWFGSTNLVHQMNLTKDELKWEEIPGMNVERCFMGATVLNDMLVVVGGYDDGGNSLSTGECFNPIVNSWQNISLMESGTSQHALVACKGSIYFIGGCVNWSGQPISSVKRHRPPSAAWEEIRQLQAPRRDLVAVNCNDVIYAIGGYSGNSTLKSAEKYDVDNNQWTYISDMKFARDGLSACVMQGKIYVVGGEDDSGEDVKEIECYDPSTDEWSIVGEIDENLCYHSIVAV